VFLDTTGYFDNYNFVFSMLRLVIVDKREPGKDAISEKETRTGAKGRKRLLRPHEQK
jgi:hypothetical protein